MYSTGTVTTTANSTKLIGTGTKWLNNINRVSAEQAIQIQINNTVHNNSIQSIQSDTELTLNFPLPTAATGAKYVILTTMVHSVSDAMNKIVSMNGANVQFSDILTRWMTEQGIITVTLPDQTTQQLRTTKEMDKQLDGKLDKTSVISVINGGTGATNPIDAQKNLGIRKMPNYTNNSENGLFVPQEAYDFRKIASYDLVSQYPLGISGGLNDEKNAWMASGNGYVCQLAVRGFTDNSAPNLSAVMAWTKEGIKYRINGLGTSNREAFGSVYSVYSTQNTTKDSNGNLKAASPIVKLFADDIELNDESEGVEMEHLGIGHYLIKGVVGFNADGAWGINNGFVIPQDHNGKNMVLIDYEVRPDGDIEIFVFHQQNADMPERFQNKRIKHFDEEGVPVYFENYEPCDVPESRWIDMRVEMPPNSLYNQKQAEAERLAKLEAERLAQEEAKCIAEEKGA
ncbi:hypothetical protein M0J40_RS13695 [Providencia rettgeri]|nr:hypothetical protein [Providencia rettgeri]